MTKSKRQDNQLELQPDAWARFERAVDVVAKSPAQHRTKAKRSRMRKKKAPPKRGWRELRLEECRPTSMGGHASLPVLKWNEQPGQ